MTMKELLLLPCLLAGLALSGAAAAAGDHPDDWVEGSQAADDGATRDFYNRAASLPWANFLGDWHDAAGTPQGDVPYDSVSMVDDDVAEYIQWDVTTLVEEWLNGVYPNRGLLLRNTSSGATHRFYSREHPTPSQRPELVVNTSGGSFVLTPQADTYLASSTFQGFGDDDVLQTAGDSRVSLLRFDLAGIPDGATLLSAGLRLFVFAEFGAGELGVFRSSQGHSEPPSLPVAGIAGQYFLDQGLENHPAVIQFTDFEDATWGLDWSYGTTASTLDRVTADSANLFQSFDQTALRARVPAGGNTALNVGYRFEQETGSEPEEIYFRYYLRFGDNWSPIAGGKLPGIAGRYPGTALEGGWGGRRSTGSNGWSARGLYRINPPAGNTFEEHVPTGNYVYHADMGGSFGDNHLWQNDHRGLLRKNRWYCVEMYLQLNTPGLNDGVLRGWIDGRLAWEKTDWRWRDIGSLNIQEIWLNVYHGGTTASAQDMHVYLDHVVIASQYIGPAVTDGIFVDGFE